MDLTRIFAQISTIGMLGHSATQIPAPNLSLLENNKLWSILDLGCDVWTINEPHLLKRPKLCKVSRRAGHISANIRPHQPRMHVVIPCDHLCLNANTQNQGKKIAFQLLAYTLLSLTMLPGSSRGNSYREVHKHQCRKEGSRTHSLGIRLRMGN